MSARGGGLCSFCLCDSDSDGSSVYVKERGGDGATIAAGVKNKKHHQQHEDNNTANTTPENTPPTKLKAKKLSRMRKKADAATTHHDDEYIDYSSSTSVERLARDVETVLRNWHVVDGSDRHASMRVRLRDATTTTTTTTRGGRSATTTSNSAAATQPPLLEASHQSVQLLRSEQLSWQVSFYLPNGRHVSDSIDLELALWDGDGLMNPADQDEEHESLPLSLRRKGLANMPLNVFANFSTLFGIGQHITLTPLHVNLGKDLWEYLCESIQQRHTKAVALPAATSVLSSWLQAALNLATMSSQCLIPTFGLWGPYQPQKQQLSHFLADQAASILPAWLEASRQDLQIVKDKSFRRRRRKQQFHLNSNHVPPVLTGQCLTPPPVDHHDSHQHHRDDSDGNDDDEEEKNVIFWAALLPHVSNARLTGTDSRLTVWGNVLLQHCADESVALWGARHVYSWIRPTHNTQYTGLFMDYDDDWDDKIWRKRPEGGDTTTTTSDSGDSEGRVYRLACQRYALKLMEQSAGVSDKEPLWGPVLDPLASIHATVTWNATKTEDSNVGLQPLLALPLKIRSKHSMSTADYIEAEESIEHSILDPYRPGVFVVQVQGDTESAAATLTATQRCVLAALIRTATLPAETMLSHLLDEHIMEGWDTKAGNEIANQLADRIQAQPGTRALVGAMDWENAAEDMISVDEAENVVHRVLDVSVGHGFPEPPEGDCGPVGPEMDELWKPLLKAAPFGRLVSNLFVQMASVRSPSSMVLVFSLFCRELRHRWDERESLPNMNFVPGLDPATDSYTPKRCFSNVGEKASFAAQVNSSEPDPDDWNCLVGQKMQVFNLCVETAIAEELRKVQIIESLGKNELPKSPKFQTPRKGDEKPLPFEGLNAAVFPSPQRTDSEVVEENESLSGMGLLNYNTKSDDGESLEDGEDIDSTVGGGKSVDADYQSVGEDPGQEPVSTMGRIGNHASSVYVEQVVHQAAHTPIRTKTKSLMSGGIDTLDWTSENDDSTRTSRMPPARSTSGGDDGTRSMASQSSYYDADEGGKVPSIFQLIIGEDDGKPNAAASVLEMMIGKDRNAERSGARCPVQGAVLQNGEQLYAPYLRRPSPLTDDVVVQRRMMLARQKGGSKPAAAMALEQLDIAHRFQIQKLSSDMSAFKAANPWASFTDFTEWYGNPVNPLEEYAEARQQDIRLGLVSEDTIETSIARSSEASVLTEVTKRFWEETWESAQPKTAAENDPLFDPVSVVEMCLHYLEALHPATLLCNVLAVNLSASYFGLVLSAEEALEIPSVRTSLRRLRKKIEIAINLLSLDAVTSGQVSNPLHPGLSSVEAMAACESACIILSENEVLLSRGRSLLSKFPGKFELIDKILKASEGSVISVDNENERRDILRTVLSQQSDPTSTSTRPSPTLREYLLRNYDYDNPCQLCVRYGNHVKDLDSEGGLLMAITKTQSQGIAGKP